MSKYRVISAVLTADPKDPNAGTLHRRETEVYSADEAHALYRASLTSAVNADPFPVAFRVRMQELRADNRYHDLHSASY